MTTLAQIRKQIEQLEKHAAELVKAERAKAIATIQSTMAEFSITLADLGSSLGRGSKVAKAVKSPAPTKAKAAVAAKYRDPKTGKTWSGRGKPPLWIGKGNRDKFLIQAESAAVKAERATPKVKASPAKTSKPKAVAKKAPVASKPKAAAKPTKSAPKKAVAANKPPVKKAAPTKAAKKPSLKTPTPKSPAVTTPAAAPAAASAA